LKAGASDETKKITKMAAKEYKILKQLDHPNIMRLIDVYKDAETLSWSLNSAKARTSLKK